MRRVGFVFLLLVGFATAAHGSATPVSIAQVEQMLAADRSKSDAGVAEQISGVILTERASSVRLARWEAEAAGPHTREALIALADASAFLELPAAEVPAMAVPDVKSQGKILELAIEYVSKTMVKLPNFFATRETTQFEDLPTVSPVSTRLDPQWLHVVGRSSVGVTYREGEEIRDKATVEGGKPVAQELGLTTRGEFGPILGLVLADALRSSVSWGHWEQGAGGPEAVFRYRVPQQKSHYRVTFPFGASTEQLSPPYHGEIAVDSATGSVLRVTVVSDLPAPFRQFETAIVVEYGAVDIGGHSYICPLKGAALSRVPVSADTGLMQMLSTPKRTQVNDVAFTKYHVFRSQTHILSASEAKAQEVPAGETASRVDKPESAGATEVAVVEPAAADDAKVAPESHAEVAAVLTPPAGAASAAAGTPRSTSAAPAGATILHANANLVLLDVVVTDRDEAVHGLERGRFHVFENGREQAVTTFEEHRPMAVAAVTPSTLPPHMYSNVPDYPKAAAVNVLLLDGLNTPLVRQAEVKRQVLEYLKKMQPGTSLAVFTLTTRLRLALGFTTDVAQIQRAVESSKNGPKTSVVMAAEGGSSMENAAANMANSTGSDDPTTLSALLGLLQFAADVKVLQTDQRVAMTLDALQQLARYLNGIPGRKNLIWFSGSFPIALGPPDSLPVNLQGDSLRNMRSYAEAIHKTDDLLARARVAVYPVDARGLVAAPTSNAEFTPQATLVEGQGGTMLNRHDVPNADMNFLAQLALEQGSMKDIAEQTGGHAYLDTNGLKEAVAKVIENGSSYYTMGYVPAGGRRDGQFRNVRVQMDGAKYSLNYRRGYYADDPNHPAGGRPAAASASGPMAAAMLLGAPVATQILFQARVLPSTDPQVKDRPLEAGPAGDLTATLKGPLRRFVVDLTVDPAGVSFTETAAGGRLAEVGFALAAYDGETRRVNLIDRGARLEMTAAQYAQVMSLGLPLRLALDVPSGPVVLRVGVYDPASGHTGSLEVPVGSAR